jgi:cytochrome P450
MKLITPAEIKFYYNYVEESLVERTKLQKSLQEKPETQQRLDMFHFLISAKDPETDAPAYTKDELWAEANMLIIAGADTTAISMSGVFFYLVRHEIPLRKLAQEIRSAFASADDIIPGPKLQSCVYLKAVIEEAMRLAPTGGSELPRQVRAAGATINGEHYPAGVIVGAAVWAQTRNHVYGDPYIFRPERWIIDEEHGVTAESVAELRSNFNHFSRGPYSCPGKNMALLELMLTVAKTVWWFDVQKPEGDTSGEGNQERQWGERDTGILQMRDAYISILEGSSVQFRKRKL